MFLVPLLSPAPSVGSSVPVPRLLLDQYSPGFRMTSVHSRDDRMFSVRSSSFLSSFAVQGLQPRTEYGGAVQMEEGTRAVDIICWQPFVENDIEFFSLEAVMIGLGTVSPPSV